MVSFDEPPVRRKGPPPAEGGCLDASLAELAARQHGVVSLAQLRALGLSARGVQKRAAAGRLHRLHRGVYAVGHPKVTLDGRRLAAVMAAGPKAALSHRSAAAVWGIRRGPETRIELTTSDRGRKPPAGTRLHRVRTPLDAAVASHNAIPVTTVARTLLDLADVLTGQALARAVHEAERRRILDMRELEATLTEAKGRRGRRKLTAALATRDQGPTRSVLEERFADLVARSDLPSPRRNVHLHTRDRLIEVDNLWAGEKLVVELDGAAAHRTARAFHEDRARDLALTAEGYAVVRLTWRNITEQPEGVMEELRSLLRARAALSAWPPRSAS
ncbi:MAG TPA: type IV toxin-antitoxin system AbiEi family antitoxin domain-containing protein [Solirubrobacteraceae bacterium]|nr:type IV toxin-antitoxin system AbiEi family antitoxin domain-containing protein [Solirubrobacteraceae bacterium]